MAKDNVYITIPDEQANEICGIIRQKRQTSSMFRSGDIAALIEGMFANFCTLKAEKVVEE